jgi:hypothetical protein
MTLDQEALIYGMERKQGESDPDFEHRIEAACAVPPHSHNAIRGMFYAVLISMPFWLLIGAVVYFGIFGPFTR